MITPIETRTVIRGHINKVFYLPIYTTICNYVVPMFMSVLHAIQRPATKEPVKYTIPAKSCLDLTTGNQSVYMLWSPNPVLSYHPQ